MAAGVGVAESIVEGAGLAGAPNGGVVSVQGVAGGTGIPVTPGPFDAGDALATGTTPREALYIYNTAANQWDRLKESTADAVPATGIVATEQHVFNGATYDRAREAPAGDSVAPTGIPMVAGMLFNPSLASWDRPRTVPTASGLTGNTGLLAAGQMLATSALTDNARARDLTTAASATGVPKVGPARLNSYGVVARLTTRPYYLSHVFGAAGRFQYLTLFHGAGSTKQARLVELIVWLSTASAAANIAVDLSRITAATTPATGNPAVIPQAASTAAAAAELTALCLPTTQGTELSAANPFRSQDYRLGITGAVPVVDPPPPFQPIVLWPPAGGFAADDPLLRAGVAEGWAIVVDVSVAATIAARVDAVVIEE